VVRSRTRVGVLCPRPRQALRTVSRARPQTPPRTATRYRRQSPPHKGAVGAGVRPVREDRGPITPTAPSGGVVANTHLSCRRTAVKSHRTVTLPADYRSASRHPAGPRWATVDDRFVVSISLSHDQGFGVASATRGRTRNTTGPGADYLLLGVCCSRPLVLGPVRYMSMAALLVGTAWYGTPRDSSRIRAPSAAAGVETATSASRAETALARDAGTMPAHNTRTRCSGEMAPGRKPAPRRDKCFEIATTRQRPATGHKRRRVWCAALSVGPGRPRAEMARSSGSSDGTDQPAGWRLVCA